MRAEVIRLACELPAESEVPLARWSSGELAREAVARGICEQISGVTVWRWLSEDAIKPWQHRSWIFPRDPDFTAKAGRIFDLYGGRWEGELLHPGDYVVCCDEKPSIQARHRKHATLPAAAGAKRGQRVEHEYERGAQLTPRRRRPLSSSAPDHHTGTAAAKIHDERDILVQQLAFRARLSQRRSLRRVSAQAGECTLCRITNTLIRASLGGLVMPPPPPARAAAVHSLDRSPTRPRSQMGHKPY
ncbi:hypothetical protein BH18ACT13_BH18ACT13_09950 [soil metagenome]